MNCGVGHRCSLDPMWLWRGGGSGAAGVGRPLAWEPPCAAGAAVKKKKKKKKKEIQAEKTKPYEILITGQD